MINNNNYIHIMEQRGMNGVYHHTIAKSMLGGEVPQEHEDHAFLNVEVVWR